MRVMIKQKQVNCPSYNIKLNVKSTLSISTYEKWVISARMKGLRAILKRYVCCSIARLEYYSLTIDHAKEKKHPNDVIEHEQWNFNLLTCYHINMHTNYIYDVINTLGFFCFRCWNIKFCFLSSCSMYSSTNFEMISTNTMMMMMVYKNVDIFSSSSPFFFFSSIYDIDSAVKMTDRVEAKEKAKWVA